MGGGLLVGPSGGITGISGLWALIAQCPRRRSTARYFFFFGGGTFAPAFRACESPIAIACLRLVTFFPDLPLFNVPFLRSCIAFFTLLAAFGPYLLAMWNSRSEISLVDQGW